MVVFNNPAVKTGRTEIGQKAFKNRPHLAPVEQAVYPGSAPDQTVRANDPDRLECDDLDPTRPENRTEQANAKRFVQKFGDRFRYVGDQKRILWFDGRRWVTDNRCFAEQSFRVVADELWYWYTQTHDPEILRAATSAASNRGVGNSLKMVRFEPGIAIGSDDLNRDPWLLNVLNGTLDLRTGKLRHHDSADLITALIETDYDLNAKAPVWEKFLQSTFAKDAEVIGFIQRWFGYCLSGEVTEQKLPVFWGGGANGKSVLVNAVLYVLGPDYAGMAAPDLLLSRKHDSHPTEVADLYGKRLAVASESDEGRELAEGRVKLLTGGDRLKARGMHENFWEFQPTAKFVFVTNHKPTVRGGDHGIWRRLLLVPFNQRFWNPDKDEAGPPNLKQDPNLLEKLKAERSGILAWMVRGCREWQPDGLKPPKAVLAATNDYQTDEDRLGNFLADCCCLDPTQEVTAKAVLDRYKQWCVEQGENSLSEKKFGTKLLKRPGITKRLSNGTIYCGLCLRDDLPDPADPF